MLHCQGHECNQGDSMDCIRSTKKMRSMLLCNSAESINCTGRATSMLTKALSSLVGYLSYRYDISVYISMYDIMCIDLPLLWCQPEYCAQTPLSRQPTICVHSYILTSHDTRLHENCKFRILNQIYTSKVRYYL